MANTAAPGRFIIDTPSGVPISDMTYIKSIIAPGAVTITDKKDILLWYCDSAGIYSLEQHWTDGFKVTALNSVNGKPLLIFTGVA